MAPTLNRKTHRAYNRVKEGNFALNGLMGFDLHGKTVGLIGLGKIGLATARMKPGVMLINTSRGALIDTRAVIEALKREQISYLGLDVYEEEANLFFEGLSNRVIQDDVFMRLLCPSTTC